MNSKLEASCREHGIDLDGILGEYKSFFESDVFTSFQHIVRNLLGIVTLHDPQKPEQHRMIERTKQDLIRYMELIREFPDFREAHLKSVHYSCPLGRGDTSAYVNQMYAKLKGKSPEH